MKNWIKIIIGGTFISVFLLSINNYFGSGSFFSKPNEMPNDAYMILSVGYIIFSFFIAFKVIMIFDKLEKKEANLNTSKGDI